MQWLDKGQEHPHRIALSAHVDLVPGIIEDITRALEGRVKVGSGQHTVHSILGVFLH